MTTYTAPIKDMQFALRELAGLDDIARLPGCEDATGDLVDSVLEGAATFAAEVWGPLNASGDAEGLKWHDGEVSTPKGFVDAYRQFTESGWNGLRFPVEFGGQGLPKLVDTAVMEMWNASNLAFSMAPLLTQGAIEALLLRGTDAIYEGTTGIQANDLVGRKLLREGGRSMHALIDQIGGLAKELERAPGADLRAIGARLRDGAQAMSEAVDWILATGAKDINAVLAGAVPFLNLCGVVCGGWQMARAASVAQRKLDAGDGDSAFHEAKIATARFYADQDLTRARGLADAAIHAAASTMALAEDEF